MRDFELPSQGLAGTNIGMCSKRHQVGSSLLLAVVMGWTAGCEPSLSPKHDAIESVGASNFEIDPMIHFNGTPSSAWQAWIARQVDPSPEGSEFIPPVESLFTVGPEQICDADGRTHVPSTKQTPWSAHCYLIITTPAGKKYGTGWLMGPRLVVTAGHCVHGGLGGRYFSKVEVIPGSNGPGDRPFGSQVSRELRAAAGWTTGGRASEDYGAIILEREFEGSPATLGTRIATDDELNAAGTARVSGYPVDKNREQWTHEDALVSLTPSEIRYWTDTLDGNSGAPVLQKGVVVAIHNWPGCPNYGVRVNDTVQRQLNEWLSESNQ